MSEVQSPIQGIIRGALQILSSVYASRLINFGVQIFLVNLLLPEDFGHIDLALGILAILVAMRDLGLHLALLHLQDQVDQLAPTHFILGTSFGALSTITAILLALFYNKALVLLNSLEIISSSIAQSNTEPIVAAALITFAISDLFLTAALTAETQLRRDFEFGRLALLNASATLSAAAAGLIIAYLGGGVWALIIGFFPQSVVYATVRCILLWSYRPPPLNRIREFNFPDARRLIGYGFWYWIGGIPKTLVLHYDKLIVVAFVGFQTQGLYGRAHAFAQMPTIVVTLAIVSVTGAIYARFQKDRKQLSTVYHRTLRLIVRTTVPFSCIIALEAPRWIQVFRAEWLPAVPILQWLILYSLCRPVLEDLHVLLQSLGEPRKIAQFSSLQACILVITAPFLTLKMGVTGTAISMNLMAFSGLILALRIVRKFTDFPIIKSFAPPLLAGVVGFTLHILGSSILTSFPLIIGVILGSTIFAVGYSATLLALEKETLLYEFKTVWNALKTSKNPA